MYLDVERNEFFAKMYQWILDTKHIGKTDRRKCLFKTIYLIRFDLYNFLSLNIKIIKIYLKIIF